jgi:hypothetical protein
VFRSYQPADERGYGHENGSSASNGNGHDGGHGTGTATLVREPGTEPAGRAGAAPSSGRGWRPLLPLAGVLALQAVISLTLARSNTAYADEAYDLGTGQQELAHWIHGAPLPLITALPGSAIIYPPLGALANDIGGLMAARILSLLLMLGATVLLYSAANRLLGRRAAIAAAVLWAVSVPALKLGAYATFDALAVFFVCLAAWLIVQANFRRRSAELAILAALALLVSNMAGYSYVIYDIPVLAFALCAWNLRYGFRRAGTLMLWMVGALGAAGFVIPTVLGMWTGFIEVTLGHKAVTNVAPQTFLSISESAWEWAGLILVLGTLGAITAIAGRASKSLVALLCVLAASAFVVPIYQLHVRTIYTMDEHLACGLWLASMPAGYLVARAGRLARPKQAYALLAAVAVLAFPLVTGWVTTYSDFQSWPSAAALIARVRPLVETPHKQHLLIEPAGASLLNYYTGNEARGPRWNTGALISVSPTNIKKSGWKHYFLTVLKAKKYYLIALEMPLNSTAFVGTGGKLPTAAALASKLGGLQSSQPANYGTYLLAKLITESPDYRLRGIEPYSDHLKPGAFLVWQWTGAPATSAASPSSRAGAKT